MSGNAPYSEFRSSQSGSILTAALGAVAFVGLLSYGAYTLLSGPVRSASNVTNSSKTQGDMDAIAKVLVTKKTEADADGTPEMPAPVGGMIPATVFPVAPVDQWNRPYTYCAWNTEGSTKTAVGTLLDGSTSTAADPSFVLISGGPDRTVSTVCTAASPFVTSTQNDDLVFIYQGDGNTTGGPNGSGAGGGGGSTELWTDNASNIQYQTDSVLVGSFVGAPGSVAFQVKNDARVEGNVGVGNQATLQNLSVADTMRVDDDVTLSDNGATGPVEGNITSTSVTEITGTDGLLVTDTSLVSNLNADLLDGQHGAYYLDLANATGTVDPNSLPTVTGDITLTRQDATTALVRVVGVRGTPLPAIGVLPSDGDIMRYNSVAGAFQYWRPQYDPTTSDLSGYIDNNTVIKIQGRPVSNAAPTANQLLGWNNAGSTWAPMSVGTTGSATVVAYTGINFLATSTNITAGSCPTNRIPKYNGTTWSCTTDATTGYDQLPIDLDAAPANKRIISANSSADPLLGFWGYANTYVGMRAGKGLEAISPEPATTNSTRNSFMGYEAGKSITTGYQNTFLGKGAGAANTTGYSNTYIGYDAATANATGFENTVLGYFAGNNASATYTQTTIIGAEAGGALTNGPRNTLIGYRSGYNALTNGADNTFVGQQSGTSSSASNNTLIGAYAGEKVTGSHNTAIGDASLGGNTTSMSGSYNTVAGSTAGASLTTGSRNTLMGYRAGYSLVSGSGNTFMGWGAGDAETTSNGNIYIGESSGGAKTGAGEANTLIGSQTGELGTDFSNEVFVGVRAGRYANGSSNNVIIGHQAAEYMTTATNNVIIGQNAARDGDGSSNFTGSNNVIIGKEAAYSATTGPTTASDNVVIGNLAGQILTTGSGNIIIGKGMNAPGAAQNDWLTIGTSQAGVGAVFYGDMTTGNMTLKGTLTVVSDRRLKKNIHPIENAMQKIMKLNGVIFRWKESYKKDDRDYLGVIAQDVKKVVPEAVFQLGEGKLSKYMSVSYEQFVPLLIEGIKEQDKELDALNVELDALLKKEEAKK